MHYQNYNQIISFNAIMEVGCFLTELRCSNVPKLGSNFLGLNIIEVPLWYD